MRLPRVQFTVRRLMIMVAVAALALAVGIPVFNRLLWLYRTPLSSNIYILGEINPRWTVLKTPPHVGEPVPVQFTYQTGLFPTVPSGLPFRIVVEVKLIDSARAVVEAHQRTLYLVAGRKSDLVVRGEMSCDLTPPRPGYYMVRYEMHATDLFGRTGMTAAHTGGFTAQ